LKGPICLYERFTFFLSRSFDEIFLTMHQKSVYRRTYHTKRGFAEKNTRKKQNPHKSCTNNNGEEEETTLRRAEEEEEEGERRCREGSCGGYGTFEARTDEDVDGVGVASQGCVCLACDFEIEYDGSVLLFEGE